MVDPILGVYVSKDMVKAQKIHPNVRNVLLGEKALAMVMEN